MRVRWEVEDGYGGKSRPQTVEIDDADWLDCEDDDERDCLIDEAVDNDFVQRITYYVKGVEQLPEGAPEYKGLYK